MFAFRHTMVGMGFCFGSISASNHPNITVQPHCADGDQHGWPSFETEVDLRANKPWASYFRAVYGDVPSSGYPICTYTLSHLYRPHLDHAGVKVPAMSSHCPTSPGQYYSTMTDHQESWSTWIWNPNLAQPASKDLPGHTWVEVIHQRFWVDFSITWLYYAPGTAIWMNLGNTRAYDDHDGATQDLLNKPCDDPLKECGHFVEIQLAGLALGLDTLQFRKHADNTCDVERAERRNTAIEIMDFHGPGMFSCGQISSGQSRRYRAGWEAASLCDCDNTQKTINCAGFGIRALGESITV